MSPQHVQASFTRLDRELPIPEAAHPGDAAIDLCCRVDVTLEPGHRGAVPTGLAVAIPEGHAGLVLPRSGHAARHGVGVVNGPGLIDSGYRGEISVLLINHGVESVSFSRGERIAQLAIVPIPAVEWVEVDSLDETARGSGGFGSTGS
jgi:dUTP pyrophosphatase